MKTRFHIRDIAALKSDRRQLGRVTAVSVDGAFIKIEGDDTWLFADDYINVPIA